MKLLFNLLFDKTPVRREMGQSKAKLIRGFLATTIFAIGISAAGTGNAACTIKDGGFSAGSIDMGNVAFSDNVAIGTVIATKQTSYDSVIVHEASTCGDNVPSTSTFTMSGTNASGIYATNIPGIGVRIYLWSDTAGYYGTPTSPTLVPNSWTYSVTSGGAYGTGHLQIKVDLVATGPIVVSNTNLLSYSVSPWYTVRANDGTGQLSVSSLTVAATIVARTCSVTTSSVAVALPPAFVSNLTTAGSTTGTTPFNLGITCSQGTNVNVTLTDASNTANRSTTLGLAPGSFASGVGLQILNKSTPIAYGDDSATAGNINQWSAGAATGGAMSIPLTARYIRTSGTLVPGTVKGIATFTMSYQ